MTLEALKDEANALLLEGFSGIEQPWREGAVVNSVSEFAAVGVQFTENGTPCLRVTKDGVRIETYGQILQMSHGDVAAGKHRDKLRQAGRNAGEKMRSVVAEELGNYPGQNRTVHLTVLNEKVAPYCESVEIDSGQVSFLGYHDFGVTAEKAS